MGQLANLLLCGVGGANAAGGGGAKTLMQIITDAGLTANLALVLDAGDSNSYSGSGTSFLDTSGSANDFTISGSATFNGSAGALSVNEYFSVPTTVTLLTEATSGDGAFADTYHRNNAAWTMLFIYYDPGGHTNNDVVTLFASASAIAEQGVRIVQSYDTLEEDGNLTVQVFDTASPMSYTDSSAGVVDQGAINLIGFRCDEAGTSYHFRINGTNEAATSSAFSGPAAGNATDPVTIFGVGSDAGTFRFYGAMIWSAALSTANFDTLYTALKAETRFSGIP